ncbi:MAG: hypothetical protein HY744_20300 [Deltaproteobacteria bacterium]|nr:hypothetical protein [Deltaproteobacteria bacterium]
MTALGIKCAAHVGMLGALLALGGCADGASGTVIGRFQVQAARAEETCGAGVLASPESFAFTVLLRRVGSSLYWTEGQKLLVGTVAADGKFELEQRVQVDMRSAEEPAELAPEPQEPYGYVPPPEPAAAPVPCVIERTDRRLGALEQDAAQPSRFRAFSGELSYDFAPTDGSDCADLCVGPDAVAERLPCTIAYDLSAIRAPGD